MLRRPEDMKGYKEEKKEVIPEIGNKVEPIEEVKVEEKPVEKPKRKPSAKKPVKKQ